MVSYRSHQNDYNFNYGTQCNLVNSLAVRSPYVSSPDGSRAMNITSYDFKEDELSIIGQVKSSSSIDYDPPVDHRMVMVAYLFMRFNGGGKVSNSHAVKKSFPRFFEEMA